MPLKKVAIHSQRPTDTTIEVEEEDIITMMVLPVRMNSPKVSVNLIINESLKLKLIQSSVRKRMRNRKGCWNMQDYYEKRF